ncbi:hypothetical protein V3O24_04480 [Methylobacter sp. Wu8]|uniref:hypothetical protein n=1 Tax=Methylobacter sp. Wu8 TaxID=3118457 RepID=UPI002F33ABC5
MTAYYNENDPKAAAWLRQLIKNGAIAPGEVDERSITEVQPSDLNGFTQIHLFAGIGGWSLALRIAGLPDDYPIWTGSCPCPPFSVAGKKKACPECQSASLLPHPYRTGVFACCDCGRQWHADERHLWPEFHRLIQECRPAIVFGEQVAGADGEVWLSGVRATLEILGYGVGAANIGAHSVGSYHQRQRLYWLAHRDAIGFDSGRTSAGCKTGQLSGVSRSGEYGVMADDQSERCERGQNTAEQAGWISLETNSSICCMAHANGGNAGTERQQSSRKQRLQPENCRSEQLGDSGSQRLPHSQFKTVCRARRQSKRRAALQPSCAFCMLANTDGCHEIALRAFQECCCTSDRSGDDADAHNPDWLSADWIYCRDDKWRPVESGTFPLVDGLPKGMVYSGDPGAPIDADQTAEARVMRLRGYGNAIHPHLAAEFISLSLEVLESSHG